MFKHQIEIAVGVLTALFIGAIGIEFFSIAGLVGIEWRIVAIMLMVAAYIVAMAMVLVTNTRRPAGIDPNEKPIDPFALPTESLWQEGMPERRKQKRRANDIPPPDPAVVERLIDHFETKDSDRPMAEETPQWALDLQAEHPDERRFNDP